MKIIPVNLEIEEQKKGAISLILEYYEYGSALSMKAANISFVCGESECSVQKAMEKFRPENGGNLFMIESHNRCVGIGAYRNLGNGRCEMKRVYLQPEIRGKGFGRKLVKTLIDDARSRGFSEMVLESGTYMSEARQLYETLGFIEIEPYEGSEQGENHLDCLYYMQLKLQERT